MSDTQEGDTQATAAPTAAHQIPKYRLDEEIAEKRRLQAELDSLRSLIPRLMPQQAAAPAQPEDPEVEQFKESNPVMYKRLKEQELRTRQVSASLFQQQEEMDRAKFINWAGSDEANRIGPTIEQKLDELRRKHGNFTMNRTDLYNYMVGQEAVQSKRAPKPKDPATPNATPKAAAQATVDDVPTSDPSFAQTPTGGAATGGGKEPSLEELEAKLANFIL